MNFLIGVLSKLILFVFCCADFASAQPTGKSVMAEKGEGIYSLLRRHGLDPGVYANQFIQINKEALGEGNLLKEGISYILPASEGVGGAAAAAEPAAPKTLEFPIFGEKYEKVTVADDQLAGAVYYLMAGHGGPDPGAIGDYGPYTLSEDEYAYDVTLRLARRLIEHGATVYMIIQDENDGIRDDPVLPMDNDEVCYTGEPIPLNHKARLRQRTEAVNQLYLKHKGAYQRLLSIHVDSRSEGENIDVFFYHHHRSRSGQKLANHIHQTFLRKYSIHQPNRNYYGSVSDRSGLYVVKHTHPPIVFIELGNIQNTKDQRRFVLSDNRQALANWITEGAIADFKDNE